ncbi:hypothetical protein AB1Y20_006403 [Prymnesium parvum]|uniref:Structural maintenance of chromosomes protein n=1 Tax=Prymnesium parvum TaxID=97485 RepID=A0AB34J2M3_PRYPA
MTDTALAATAAAPRLMISKMVLENFKSYAGEITIGPFDKNMTSVVGPNGSGKSNVIDAMLFVFGFKAKQMRQNKVSELIHSSEQHPSLKFAKVSVYFQYVIDQEDGGFTVVDGSQLVVSREAKSDNTSTYRVNEKGSDYKQVTTLLREHGIDLDHNRFLILQGEVEQIAMMKPKAPSAHEDGLLEYLEDIIGSNKYVEDIEAASKAVEELNEQRSSRHNAMKASDQQVQALEERKNEAEEYLRTERELNQKKAALYQINGLQARTYVAEVTEKHAALSQKLADERAKSKESEEKLTALEKAYKKSKKESDKVAEQLEKQRKEFQGFEREEVKLREEAKHGKAQLKKAQALIDKEMKKLGEVKGEVKAFEQDIPRLEAEDASLQSTSAQAGSPPSRSSSPPPSPPLRLPPPSLPSPSIPFLTHCHSHLQAEEQLEGLYEALKGQAEPLRLQIEEKQRAREPLAQKLTALISEEELARSELQLLVDKKKDAAATIEERDAALQRHHEATAQSHAQLAEAESQLAEAKAKAAELQREQSTCEKEEAALVDEVRAARARYEEGKAARASVRSLSGRDAALLAAKRAGGLAGYIGRLGSLGGIDPQYDVAISTCCPQLDHLVVTDTASAEACLDLMRKEQLGIATCIILDRQQHLASKMAPIKPPEGALRLFDLVECAPEHRVAFYSALRDTLVCADKTRASSIAFSGGTRYRVVTTDGVVINTSGTMEGGGKPMSGRMRGGATADAPSEKELEKLGQHAEKLDSRLEELRSSRAAHGVALRGVLKQSSSLATHAAKLRAQQAAAAAQQAALEAAASRARGEAALSGEEEARAAALEAELRRLAVGVGAARRGVEAADAGVAELQEAVLAMGGVKLRAQKSKVETLGEARRGVQEALGKARVQLEVARKSVEKVEKAVEKHRKGAEEQEAKNEATRRALEELHEAAGAVLEAVGALTGAHEAKEEEMKAMEAEYAAFKGVVAKVRTVEVDMAAQLEDYARAKKDNEARVAHWEAKLRGVAEAAARAAAEARVDGEEEEEEGVDVEMSEEALGELDAAELQAEISAAEKRLHEMNGNLSAIAEYRQRVGEFKARVKEFDEVTAARDAQRAAHERLRKARLDEFMVGFKAIGMKLKEMYQMITLGGDAELELLDSLDPFSEGIVFSVRPPKKSWKNIVNLSGGEKTLSSLALVFALHHYKPTPLYVMDEIDAALDFRNVSIVGNYIKERTRNAQFIIISLRNNMFELADRLVGIYKTHNSTKSVAIDPSAFTIAAH